MLERVMAMVTKTETPITEELAAVIRAEYANRAENGTNQFKLAVKHNVTLAVISKVLTNKIFAVGGGREVPAKLDAESANLSPADPPQTRNP